MAVPLVGSSGTVWKDTRRDPLLCLGLHSACRSVHTHTHTHSQRETDTLVLDPHTPALGKGCALSKATEARTYSQARLHEPSRGEHTRSQAHFHMPEHLSRAERGSRWQRTHPLSAQVQDKQIVFLYLFVYQRVFSYYCQRNICLRMRRAGPRGLTVVRRVWSLARTGCRPACCRCAARSEASARAKAGRQRTEVNKWSEFRVWNWACLEWCWAPLKASCCWNHVAMSGIQSK